MNKDDLRAMLDAFQAGEITTDDMLERLRSLPYEDLGFARLDHHRGLRRGFPEVVFCEGKTPAQAVEIIARMAERSSQVLATRASAELYDALRAEVPEAKFYPEARIIAVVSSPLPVKPKPVAVVTGGTSDISVAEEAAVTLEVMGNRVERMYDVGVAGIHRVLDCREELQAAGAVVVVAGMEGALASVVGGLVARPVIAVPTSVGYGSAFGGVAALLGMLNSCTPGIAVVNIDNGFGAGYLASLINTTDVNET